MAQDNENINTKLLFNPTKEEKDVNQYLDDLAQTMLICQQKYHDSIEDRDKDIERLNESQRSLEEEVSSITQKIEILQNDFTNRGTELSSCQKEKLRLEQECRDFKDELVRTKNSLKIMNTLRKENENFREERYSLLKEIETVKSELKNNESLQINQVEKMENHFQQETNKQQDITRSLEDQIKNLKHLNEEESQARERLSREKKLFLEDLEKSRVEKKQEREELSRQISMFQTKLKESEKRSQEDQRLLEQRGRKELIELERKQSNVITRLEKELTKKQRELALKEHEVTQLQSDLSRKLELAKKEFESQLGTELDKIKRKYYLEMEKARRGTSWNDNNDGA